MRQTRVASWSVGITALILSLTGAVAVEWCGRSDAERGTVERLRDVVRALSHNAAPLFAQPSAAADQEVRSWAGASGLRVTLITAEGRVHADSWTLPALLDRLENHGTRPEIVMARSNEVGTSRRRSHTTDRWTTYVAQMIGAPDRPSGFLRVAQEDLPQHWPWGSLLTCVLVAFGAGAVAEAWRLRARRAIVSHLAVWADLPNDAETAAIAEEADRRFRAERETLSRELEATRAALAEVSEGVILLDRAGAVRFANPAATALLGAGLVQERPLLEAVRHPELVATVAEVLAGGGTRHTTVVIGDGRELALRACGLDHPVLVAALVLRDLSEQRHLERARRALVADLAHELRTPLTVLGGLAEELEAEGVGGEITLSLQRQVKRLTVFAQDLEELVTIESGQMRLHHEAVDLRTVAHQVVRELAPTAQTHRVTTIVEGEGVNIYIDPVRVAQVLGNLLDNAIRYNRSGGTVVIHTACDGLLARISVKDSGMGIPAAEIPLVFQRFYRVRGQSRPEAGSGLGLAIVKHLVRALGGSVGLSSSEGHGTEVVVTFPLTAAETPPPTEAVGSGIR